MRHEAESGFQFRRGLVGLLALFVLAMGASAQAQVSGGVAGYSEYYVPGGENEVSLALRSMNSANGGLNTHALISITAWADNTIVYYDHWEDGIDFDPNNPTATADETFLLTSIGQIIILDDTPVGGIPISRNSANTYYDGDDRIYVAGGAVTVTRSAWLEDRGRAVQALAWEVYPVKPQLTTYVLPFGENLVGSLPDFERVYVLVQATANNTTFSLDVNGNGLFDDALDRNFDGDTADAGESNPVVSLQAGQTFFIGNPQSVPTPLPRGARVTVNSGLLIQGSATLQVKFVIGDPDSNPAYETRGLSAFPRGYWTKDYYAPVGEYTAPPDGRFTDIFLYNPHTTSIDIDWQNRTASGNFTIAAGATVSVSSVTTNAAIQSGQGVYFHGTDDFWGVSTIDSGSSRHEWAYSLLPTTLLYDQHFLGWAQGGIPAEGGTSGDGDPFNDSGVFITPVQDNTTVFADTNNDGTPEQTYALDRLQTQYIYDQADGDLSGTHFWATGLFTMSFGQNPDTAPTQDQAGDLGYVNLPGNDFVQTVIRIDKSANPTVVPTGIGQTTTFTLRINTDKYPVDSVRLRDFLPPNWAFVADSATITLPNATQITGAAANPTADLFWRERFNTVSFNSNADNVPSGLLWATDWKEEGESDGPGAGDLRVAVDGALATALRISNNSRALARIADLSGTTGATLRFNYRRQTTAADDTVLVQACANAVDGTFITCPAGWTTAFTITGIAGTDATYQSATVDLTSLGIDPNTATFGLRIAPQAGFDNTDIDWIDNVEIQLPGSVWSEAVLGSMEPNQELVVTFQAQTTAVLPVGTLSRNDAEVVGTRTFFGVTQTFTARDFAYVATGDLSITKSSSPQTCTPPCSPALYPGDSMTYTVTVSNPALAPTQSGVSLYDALPPGVTSVSGTTTLNRSSVADAFGTVAYTNNDGTRTWNGNWAEGNDDASANSGDLQILAGELRLNNSGGGGTNNIVRTVTLPASGLTAATIVFDYRSSNTLEATDRVTFGYSVNGGAFVVTNLDPTGTSVTPGRFSLTVANPVTSLAVRFAFPSNGGGGADYTGGDEFFFVDNLSITYDQSITFPSSNNPPDLLSSSTLYALAGGQSLVATFNVTIDNPYPNQSPYLVNTGITTTRELPVQLRAMVTNLVTVPTLQGATVAGRVWFDADAGDDQDVGEPGFANVEVVLKDQFGTPVATTYTDANGRFLFTGVEPGNGYYVEAASGVPSGLCETFPDNCTPPSTNVNRSTTFNLAPGQSYDQADIGYTAPTGTVTFGDLVWGDVDADGIRDPGEPGLGGRTVFLYEDSNNDGLFCPAVVLPTCTVADTLVASAVTNPDGSYLFPGLPTGATYQYLVTTSTPSGYISTTPTSFVFNNPAPGIYLYADFGFDSDTAPTFTLSDRVWLDADGQGDFDEGSSAGIGGVTVDLLDSSLNVIATAITAADGTFSFPGLTGSSADYTTRVTDTGGVLTNYVSTTTYAQAGQRAEPNLTADRDRRDNTLQGPPSYGYVPTRAIGDTVWYDNDADGVQDSGELGIPGAPVTLYRDVRGDGAIDLTAGAGSVATTSGSATVTGTGTSFLNYHPGEPFVVGGVMYTIASVASNTSLTLTTAAGATGSGLAYSGNSQGAGTVAVTNGNATVTGTGTTFTNYRAGDPITIAGVQYTIASVASNTSLTLTANYTGTTGSGRAYYGPGDMALGSMTTDSAGHYLFSGLSNGTYIVSTPTPAGYTYTGTGGLADTTAPAPGAQLAATISGTGNVLDRDFGFQAPERGSLSGTIWRNDDADSVIDVAEPRFAGVTVDILSGSTVVATVTTDSNGQYSATGLLPGSYTVRVTDTFGILAGHSANYEVTEVNAAPFNGEEAVTVTNGANTGNVNFGYRRTQAPTYASVGYLDAFVADGVVVVEWQTTAEAGTVGFHLLRLDPATQKFTQVNGKLLPGLVVHPQGGTYRFRDASASRDDRQTYKLVEVDVRGRRMEFGPYVVTPGAPRRRADLPEESWTRAATFERQPNRPSVAHRALAASVAGQRRTLASRVSQPSSIVKIATREAGLHYLSVARLASATGASPTQIARRIGSRQIALSNLGRSVPYLAAGSSQAGGIHGLYFFAEKVDSIATSDNVYWLSLEPGVTMAAAPAAGSGALAGSFAHTLTSEVDAIPGVTFAHDPDGDFWNWDWVFAGYAGLDTKTFVARATGVAGTGDATLTVRLQGGTEAAATPADHHVTITWNGTPVAESTWDGTDPHVLHIPLPAGSVLEGDNTLVLTGILDSGVEQSLVFLDSFDVTYERLYQAEADSLSFTVEPGAAAEVGGFTGDAVVVLDVTVPAEPAVVTGHSVELTGNGTYQLRLAAASDGGQRRYLAVLASRAQEPPAVTPWHSAGLRDASNAADYVLVAPDVLEASAQGLAAYRTGQGTLTRVVRLEDIYDEFNFGLPSPLAIRSFLQYAAKSWQVAPSSATLVGKGTWDYKDVYGIGDNLVPVALVATPHGLAPSDSRLGDIVGDDGVPDVAVGRLPFLSPQELVDYLAKVQAHEGAAVAKWHRRVVLAADDPDGGGNFPADTETVAGLFPADYDVAKVYLSSGGVGSARQALLDAINQGSLLVNYIGHGGLDRLASEGMFTTADVTALTNGSRLPLFVTSTCLAADFGKPGFRSLGEELLLHPAGGAYAVFGPSTMSEDDVAVQLDGLLMRQLFLEQERAIGEASRKALRSLEASGPQSYIRSTYNLLGEPVSRLP